MVADGKAGDLAMARNTFCFGRFRLDALERTLTKDSVPVRLGSRAFDLLLVLLERAGETVNRDTLFDLVWPDVFVSKVNLRVHISALRKVLGDERDSKRFVITVAGRGYRFIAPISRLQLQREAHSGLEATPDALVRMPAADTPRPSELSDCVVMTDAPG